MTKINTLERKLEKLQTEREAVSARLAEAQNEHSAFAGELQLRQADAARGGDEGAADRAEAHDARLARQVQRQRAALATIDGDLVQVRADLETARHDAKVERLQVIYKEAEKHAAALDQNMENNEAMADLVRLHKECYALVVELYTDRALYAGHPDNGRLFNEPTKAHGQRLAAMGYYVLGREHRPRESVHYTQTYHPINMADALRLERAKNGA
jgi:hypothetical protein